MDLRGFLLLAETVPPIELQRPKGTALINLAVAGLIVTGLYFAREILVPVALAVLFSFVLAPFVIRLQSWRVPRRLAVLVAVFVGFSIIFSLGGLMVSQANRLAEELPGYQQTLREKIQNLRGVAAGGSGTLERASKVLRELDSELHNPARGQAIDGLRRQPQRQTDPGGDQAARSGHADDAGRHHPAADPAADHDRHRHHLRDLHPDAAAGPAKPLHPAGRIA